MLNGIPLHMNSAIVPYISVVHFGWENIKFIQLWQIDMLSVCVCVIFCSVFDVAVPLLFHVGVILLFLMLFFLCFSVLLVSSCCLSVLGCPLPFLGHLRGRFLLIFLSALSVSTLCSVICLFVFCCFPLFGVLLCCVVVVVLCSALWFFRIIFVTDWSSVSPWRILS